MRKRVIIAIIITFVILFVTNKNWLSFKPMPVSLDIKGHGTININVQFNKKDDNKFKKVKEQDININLDKKSKVEVTVRRAKAPKRLKLVLSNLNINSPITITNLLIKNNQSVISDLSLMKVEGATIVKADKNEITIIPKNLSARLTYPETLHVYSDAYFDFRLFVIIMVLTYLLAYKLSNYVADFKTVKGKSWIEIFFLTIFFISLFIPMSRINEDYASARENRLLAKWYPPIIDSEINFDFGKNFNNWFNDRFYLREEMVELYSSIKLALTNQTANAMFDKETGFMYTGNPRFGAATTEESFFALQKFNDFCKTHNIKLYVLLVPNTADIYISKLFSDRDIELHNNFLNYLQNVKNNTDLKVVYPYQELLEEKNKNYMFFKTEHHWTDDGAFVAYKALMKEIQKDYPNVKILTKDDFNYSYNELVRGDFDRSYHFGTTSTSLGLPNLSEYHKIKYRYYTHKDFDTLKQKVINKKYHAEKTYYYPKGANLRVIQLGTSQNENLTEFIPFTFKNVKRIRNNSVIGIPETEEFKIMKYYEKEMLDYKPDILIFCISYTNVVSLKDLFIME